MCGLRRIALQRLLSLSELLLTVKINRPGLKLGLTAGKLRIDSKMEWKDL